MSDETVPTTKVVTLNGRNFTLSKLTLGGLKSVGAHIKVAKEIKAGDMPTEEQIDAMIAIVHAAAKKAEPTLTREEFADHVEQSDWMDTALLDAFMLVMTGSGLMRTKPAGDGAPGEEQSPASSISSPSTDSSSPQPAGGSET